MHKCDVFLQTTVSEPIGARHTHYVNITTQSTACVICCGGTVYICLLWSERDHLLTGSSGVERSIFFPKRTIPSLRKMSFISLLHLATVMFSAVGTDELTRLTKFVTPQCGTDGQFYEAGTAIRRMVRFTNVGCAEQCARHPDCYSFNFNSGKIYIYVAPLCRTK